MTDYLGSLLFAMGLIASLMVLAANLRHYRHRALSALRALRLDGWADGVTDDRLAPAPVSAPQGAALARGLELLRA